MKQEKVPYRRMVFVCANVEEKDGRPACGKRGGLEICETLKSEVKARGLKGQVRALKSGCMDLCEKGPNVMVFPDATTTLASAKASMAEGTLHSGVTPEDVPSLIEKYLV